ncbi:SDR family oxidoreductase [bacterium]|nr:SDR family oxidoreductase [candidate division CSSED10-310 bacterium]
MPDPLPLEGKTALITGGGNRLGKAFAEALLDHGANLAVHYRSSRKGAGELVRKARASGRRAVAIQGDLAEPEQLNVLFNQAVEVLGRMDILINSASIFERKKPLQTSREDWERNLAVNLSAPWHLSRLLADHLDGRPGVILNILDWRAFRADPGHFAYTVSKAALASLTVNLARAFAPSIRVNGLALGAILPPSHGDWNEQAVLGKIPAGRLGSVQEATKTMLFLVSGPEYITGDIVHLDGGRRLV